jgi:nicotinamide/nicotinate riboside kinase
VSKVIRSGDSRPSTLYPFIKIDWDDPQGAIDWPRMRAAVDHVKKIGKLPETHKSHDHLNVQTKVPLPMGMTEFWKERFTEAIQKRNTEYGTENEVINWAIMDGFLL